MYSAGNIFPQYIFCPLFPRLKKIIENGFRLEETFTLTLQYPLRVCEGTIFIVDFEITFSEYLQSMKTTRRFEAKKPIDCKTKPECSYKRSLQRYKEIL